MIASIMRRFRSLAGWLLDMVGLRTPVRKALARISGKPYVDLNAAPEEIFGTIYRTNYWGSEASRSGTGSSVERTDSVRSQLKELISELKITSLVDAACGDFAWMREMNFEAAGVGYTGVDIVQEMIDKNNSLYGTKAVRFECRNLINDSLPAADLVICRDCLVHLSDEHVLKALRNIANSGSRYLLTTSFRHTTKNKSIQTGDWRPLNLLAPPFEVGTPLRVIVEEDVEDGFGDSKTLILLDLAALRTKLSGKTA